MHVLISSGHSPSLMTVCCVHANTGAASAARWAYVQRRVRRILVTETCSG